MAQYTPLSNPDRSLAGEIPAAESFPSALEEQESMSKTLLTYDLIAHDPTAATNVVQPQPEAQAQAQAQRQAQPVSTQVPPHTGVQQAIVYAKPSKPTVAAPHRGAQSSLSGLATTANNGPQPWATQAHDACGYQPYCCAALFCTPCVVYSQRQTLLYGKLDDYVCCAGVCGNTSAKECPTCCCPGSCGLCMEALCCTPCAITGNRSLLIARHHLEDSSNDVTCQYMMYGGLVCAFMGGIFSGFASPGGLLAANQALVFAQIGSGLSVCSNCMAGISMPLLLAQQGYEMEARKYGHTPAAQAMQ